MKYRRFDNTLIVRIDKGEEILEQVEAVALREDIKLASVSALGATDDFTVGVYDVEKQKYNMLHFTGSFEIVSLLGTINTMNGAFYTHLHLSAGDTEGHVHGGHLNRANVSITCEMVITVIDGTVDRFRDESLGVNLLAL
ncbi:MAG: DNA-binding protein [Clostridia bacterium]|nr:DNA-binding protein [Clostridia bacterium]